MFKKSWFVLLIVIFLLTATTIVVGAQVGDEQYFPLTGHHIKGAFLEFYRTLTTADVVIGNPITDEFLDKGTGQMAQYFDFSLMRLYPHNPPGQQIVRTKLGEALREYGEEVGKLTATTPDCYQADHWDYPVCYSFREFYEENGGEPVFGKPISGIEFLEGRLVQFFEYSQMVWKPENVENAKVTLAPLGMTYFTFVGEDPNLLDPNLTPQYNQSITHIHASAFTSAAVAHNGDTQSINMVVVDQNNFPINGALITLTVNYPNGDSEVFENITTNTKGVASESITINSESIGMVEIKVTARYIEVQTIAFTSFRLWY